MHVLWRVINLISFSVQQLEQMVAPTPAGAPSCPPRPALTYRHFCLGCLRLFIVFAHLLHIRYFAGVGLHWSISWLVWFFLDSCFSSEAFQKWGITYWIQTEFVPQHFIMSSPEFDLTVSQCAPRMGGQAHVWNGEWLCESRCGTASAGHFQGSPNHVAATVPVLQPGDFSLFLALAKMPE